jgi:HlyD family secretion protein
MVDIKRDPPKKTKQIIYGALGVIALVAITVWVSTLEAAPPTVEAATVWTGDVQQGELLRQVRGPGTLVAEDVLFVSARTAGRIEKVLIDPGAQVTPETVIIELSNPELQLQVQNAEWEWRRAEAGFTQLRVGLEQQRLQQESVVAQVQSQYNQARMQADRDGQLYDEALTSEIQMLMSKSRAEELENRLRIESTRLQNLEESNSAQLDAQRVQVDQRGAEFELRQRDLDALFVRATITGVLQEVPVEEGQRVQPGVVLARVADPKRLKAELRIAQTQAGEVTIGQSATIDTRNGVVAGRVTRIDPAVVQGTVTVDVELLAETLPAGARPDLSVDGRIEIERLLDVMYVDRPAFGQADQAVSLFKLLAGGTEAVRTTVRFGASSVDKIVVVEGLQVGDEIILSDMSRYDTADRVRIR